MAVFSAPEDFTFDPNTGKYYSMGIITDPETGYNSQWVTWFDANTGEYEQYTYPIEPDAYSPEDFSEKKHISVPNDLSVKKFTDLPHDLPTQEIGKKKSKGLKITLFIILAIILIFGAVIGGHFAGFYSLSFLSVNIGLSIDIPKITIYEDHTNIPVEQDIALPSETDFTPGILTPGLYAGEGLTWDENEQKYMNPRTIYYLFKDDGTVKKVPSISLSPDEAFNILWNSAGGEIVWDLDSTVLISVGVYAVTDNEIFGHTISPEGSIIEFHGIVNDNNLIQITTKSLSGDTTTFDIYLTGTSATLPFFTNPLENTSWVAFEGEYGSTGSFDTLYIYSDIGFLNDGWYYMVHYGEYAMSFSQDPIMQSIYIGRYTINKNVIAIKGTIYIFDDTGNHIINEKPHTMVSAFRLDGNYLVREFYSKHTNNISIVYTAHPPYKEWFDIFAHLKQ